MKRLTFILLTVLVAAACRKVSPEQRIAQISNYFDKTNLTYADDIRRFDGQKRIDYLTLALAREIGADDIWTLEQAGENSLVAVFPGREKRMTRYSLLSASLDDPDACAAVLNTLRAFKDLKLKPDGTIHALFYSTAEDTTGLSGLGATFKEIRDAGDQLTFEMEISAQDSLPNKTFIIEDKEFFANQIIEVVPPYLNSLGTYRFQKGSYPNPAWPIKLPVYRYNLDAADFPGESAVLTVFALLLN